MCDLDEFKTYNDTYGHVAGDSCLTKVAQGIMNILSRPGDFCARYGGEEFIIILPDTSLAGAINIAEKIRKTILEMKIEHKTTLPLGIVTLSLGVAVAEEDTTMISHDELVKHADLALYKAKEKGRNQVQYITRCRRF